VEIVVPWLGSGHGQFVKPSKTTTIEEEEGKGKICVGVVTIVVSSFRSSFILALPQSCPRFYILMWTILDMVFNFSPFSHRHDAVSTFLKAISSTLHFKFFLKKISGNGGVYSIYSMHSLSIWLFPGFK
jgi:hypothetical protein